MAEQGNVLQILDLEHRGDVLDMGRQVDSGVRQMGALAQPGVGRRKKLMPVGPKEWPHLLSMPRPPTTRHAPIRLLPCAPTSLLAKTVC
jgi:hypothetical protein